MILRQFLRLRHKFLSHRQSLFQIIRAATIDGGSPPVIIQFKPKHDGLILQFNKPHVVCAVKHNRG